MGIFIPEVLSRRRRWIAASSSSSSSFIGFDSAATSTQFVRPELLSSALVVSCNKKLFYEVFLAEILHTNANANIFFAEYIFEEKFKRC